MDWKETVMSSELQKSYGLDKPQHLAGVEWQSYVSFKAGIQEVVDWIEEASHPQATNMTGISISKDEWQAFKKEQGIE